MAKSWVAAWSIVAMSSLTCCGLVPAAPSVTPSALSSSSPPQTTTSTPVIGFSESERAALRIRNVGCLSGSMGSGFAISDHTFITNRHVICGADLLQVSTFDGQDVQVTTVGAAVIADLAVVHAAQTLPATVHLAKADPPIGTAVMAMGFPLGGPITISHGHVLGYGKDPAGWSSLPMLRNDAPIAQGSSGSALLNDDGELVGVVYALTGPGSSYAVPVEILTKLLHDRKSFSYYAPCGGAPPSPAPEPPTTPCSPTVRPGPTPAPSP
jgi:S1-C subfamily serine protease